MKSFGANKIFDFNSTIGILHITTARYCCTLTSNYLFSKTFRICSSAGPYRRHCTFPVEMSEITHPTIKGTYWHDCIHDQGFHKAKTIWTCSCISDNASYFNIFWLFSLSKVDPFPYQWLTWAHRRWLVSWNLQHVAWPSHDSQGQECPTPREEQISRRSDLRIYRLWNCTCARQCHSMHWERWVLIPGNDHSFGNELSPEPEEGSGHRRRRWWCSAWSHQAWLRWGSHSVWYWRGL